MDVNGRKSGFEGCSLLHEAYDPGTMTVLLNAKADVTSITIEKMTPLHRQCTIATMKLLKISPIQECIRLLLTEPKIAVNAQDIYLRTPLHDLLSKYSDYSRVLPIVQLLLEHGADLNMVDSYKQTVFDYALEKSKNDISQRAAIRDVLLVFDAHRKKIDATAQALKSCNYFPYGGGNSTDLIVAEYCHGIRPKNAGLDTVLAEVNALLKKQEVSE